MPSVKKSGDFRNIDERFAQVLQRIFYFERADEEKSVRHFTDWYRREGFGDLKDRAMYDVLGGRSKPSPTMIVALLEYSDDVELHGLFTVDKSVRTGAAEALRTAADTLQAVAKRLEGNGE